jgi:hypothetical protein
MHDLIDNAIDDVMLPRNRMICRAVVRSCHKAVNHDMTSFGGGMILQEFDAHLRAMRMEFAHDEHPDHFIPHLDFGISSVQSHCN